MKFANVTLGAIFIFGSYLAVADGVGIDKVYDPYVQPGEREFEYRNSFYNFDDGRADSAVHRIGFGYGLTERWSAELYLIGVKENGESLQLEAVELEAKWQLTEQGEYAADWGLLFELEDKHGLDASEFTTSLLVARDFGRWTGTANLNLIYEWGKDIDDEFETAFAGQMRFRYQRRLEPAVELFIGENTLALGPAAQGIVRLTGRQQLHWEAGTIFGLNDDSPDFTLRLVLEYEF